MASSLSESLLLRSTTLLRVVGRVIRVGANATAPHRRKSAWPIVLFATELCIVDSLNPDAAMSASI